MHSDLKDIYMDFDVPKINPDMHLVEADPFKMMLQTENKTCTIQYTGPFNLIINNMDECTYCANIKLHASHNLVLYIHVHLPFQLHVYAHVYLLLYFFLKLCT